MNNLQNATQSQQIIIDLINTFGANINQIAKECKLPVSTLRSLLTRNDANLQPKNFSKLLNYYLAVSHQYPNFLLG